MSSELQPQQRETWNTRSAFVLAAIGSAVGLGNLWGFPYKLYTYGGGAFLVPYILAMAIMGIPLLIMEFSVGHWAQQSAPGAFGRVLKKYRFVGWWLVSLAFIIIAYYAVILAYCVDYLIVSLCSFGDMGLPWAAETPVIAKDYFFTDMVQTDFSMGIGIPAWKIVAGTVTAWGLVYLCLFKGVKWVGKVVLWTVPLPWIMLIVLTVRGLTLEGAIQGLEFYLEPRWEKLLEPDTWRFAFGQVFFSMSLGFAVMLSYASFLHKKSDLNNNALIIGLGDMGTSFVAGIAVFSMLGGMAFASGTAVPDLVPEGTVGLSFIVFPYGLSQLPWGPLFSCIFFLALLTLGIDSAFSIVEACLASICDSKPKWLRKWVLPGICVVGILVGLVFTCSRGGLLWLDLTDNLINGPFGILVVALAECIVIGWAWHGKFLHKLREHANERSDWKLYGWWDVIIKYVAPAFLAVLIVWSISGEVHKQIDAKAAADTAPSLKLQAIWPSYEPHKTAIGNAALNLAKAEAYRFRAARASDDKKVAEADVMIVDLKAKLALVKSEAGDLPDVVAALQDENASLEYTFPWPLVIGTLIFIAIPVGWWFGSKPSQVQEDADWKKQIGPRAGVLFAGTIMVISAVVIELCHMKGWLKPRDITFEADGSLNATAYVILTLSVLLVTGGLIWCFWRASRAAGRQDPEMIIKKTNNP